MNVVLSATLHSPLPKQIRLNKSICAGAGRGHGGAAGEDRAQGGEEEGVDTLGRNPVHETRIFDENLVATFHNVIIIVKLFSPIVK